MGYLGGYTGKMLGPSKVAVPSFSPDQIAGLQLWLKADAGAFSDAGTTPAGNNDTVQQWNDQSGNGRNASQGTANRRPTYLTNTVNGRPVVFLANTTNVGMTTAFTITRPFTLCLVEAPRATDGANHRTHQNSSNNFFTSLCRNDNENCYVDTDVASSHNPGNTNPHSVVLSMQSSAVHSAYYLDGVNVTDHDNVNNAPTGTFALGASGSANEPGNTYLCELLVYNSVLSSADRGNILSYFNNRWGT